jgi:Na+/melibiose symporter-like transporter
MFISHALMAGMFLLPFIGGGGTVAAIFFITFLVARFMVSSIAAVKVTWFYNLVPEHKRGAFTAITSAVSLIAGTVFSLAAGVVIDNFEAAGNIEGAFLTLSICILAFATVNLLTLLFSKETPHKKESEEKEKVDASLKRLFKNKNYRKLFVIQVLISMANGVAMPFFGTYQINELGFAVSFVAVINTIQSLVKLTSVAVFGKLSSRLSHKTIILISLPTIGLSYFISIFTAPQNGSVLYLTFAVIFYIGLGAFQISETNFLLSIIPEEQQTSALSLHASVAGVVVFLTTVAASPLVEFMQSRGNEIFGVTVYAQQILSAVASILYFAAAICFVTLVKEKRSVNI